MKILKLSLCGLILSCMVTLNGESNLASLDSGFISSSQKFFDAFIVIDRYRALFDSYNDNYDVDLENCEPEEDCPKINELKNALERAEGVVKFRRNFHNALMMALTGGSLDPKTKEALQTIFNQAGISFEEGADFKKIKDSILRGEASGIVNEQVKLIKEYIRANQSVLCAIFKRSGIKPIIACPETKDDL